MKVAPVMNALKTRKHVVQTLVHTGQHYDANMSDVFFEQLGIPPPDVNLAAGSGDTCSADRRNHDSFRDGAVGSQADIVLVDGDVNSTVATALICDKLGVRVGHVEAGLRSFDRTMPEEINRLVSDQVADLLFTPS
jgi:UDP-N-acetylglucosamine 2-epimerase (non-hydrolysing)